jgi:TolB-like protein/Flp pilus assembly protein TadD
MKMPWPKEAAVIAERLDKKKIAVLPLASISHDPNDEYFADGLTEELIGTMSKIGELRVISRTSIMQYKGRSEAISRIAKELGAGTVLEGSVRKEGSRVRVSIQMIDANEDNHVWAENYDGEIRDIFSVQSDIANEVAKATKVNILDDEKTRIGKIPTRNMAAYESYLRARYLMNKGAPSPHSLLESVKYLEEAIRLDQEFSLAYATLGNLYVIIGGEWMPLREAIAKAEPLISKALEMDSNLADAHVSKGNLAFQHHLDYQTAENEFRRAIDLNPSNVDAHGLYSFLLQVTGDLDGAMREAVIAQELDPVSPWALMSLLSCLVLKKAYPEALALCEKMMQLEPENPSHHLSVASLYFHMGRPDDCKREVELAESLKIGVNERADLAECLAHIGRESDARRLLYENEAERRKLHLSIGPLAFVYMALGDTEKALQILEEDVSVDPVTFLFSFQSHALDPLRGDPRFSALVEMLKLPKKP